MFDKKLSLRSSCSNASLKNQRNLRLLTCTNNQSTLHNITKYSLKKTHTCASQRTTDVTRSLYSSILRGGNRKCLRAYSCRLQEKTLHVRYLQRHNQTLKLKLLSSYTLTEDMTNMFMGFCPVTNKLKRLQ